MLDITNLFSIDQLVKDSCAFTFVGRHGSVNKKEKKKETKILILVDRVGRLISTIQQEGKEQRTHNKRENNKRIGRLISTIQQQTRKEQRTHNKRENNKRIGRLISTIQQQTRKEQRTENNRENSKRRRSSTSLGKRRT